MLREGVVGGKLPGIAHGQVPLGNVVITARLPDGTVQHLAVNTGAMVDAGNAQQLADALLSSGAPR